MANGFAVLMRPSGGSQGFLMQGAVVDAGSGGVALSLTWADGAVATLILDRGAVAGIVEAHRIGCPFGCAACVPEPTLVEAILSGEGSDSMKGET